MLIVLCSVLCAASSVCKHVGLIVLCSVQCVALSVCKHVGLIVLCSVLCVALSVCKHVGLTVLCSVLCVALSVCKHVGLICLLFACRACDRWNGPSSGERTYETCLGGPSACPGRGQRRPSCPPVRVPSSCAGQTSTASPSSHSSESNTHGQPVISLK